MLKSCEWLQCATWHVHQSAKCARLYTALSVELRRGSVATATACIHTCVYAACKFWTHGPIHNILRTILTMVKVLIQGRLVRQGIKVPRQKIRDTLQGHRARWVWRVHHSHAAFASKTDATGWSMRVAWLTQPYMVQLRNRIFGWRGVT